MNWNSIDYLRECIASVYQYTRGISFEIVVIDNASPARDDVDSLKQLFGNVVCVKSPENMGFSKANNLGYRHSSGEYLLFLNPDTKLQNPAINIMLETMKSLQDAAIVGCKLLNTDLSIQTSCIQKFPTVTNQLLDFEALHRLWPACYLWDIAPLFSVDTKPAKVEVVSGACILVKRDVFERIGLFSEDYFMYADDIDLCYKARQIGLANYYVGKALVIHHGGGSSQRRKVDHWATIMKFRAMQRFCVKRRGAVYASVFRLAIGGAALARLFVIALLLSFKKVTGDKSILCAAFGKWNAVLKWALGLDRSVAAVMDRT